MTDDDLISYLKTMVEMRKKMRAPEGFRYLCMEDFLLQHGRPFTWRPLPRSIRPGKIKQCFENAYRLARRRGWWYVEGMALGSIIPVHHAWCVDPRRPDEVIDPTWSEAHFTGEKLYHGAAFDLALVARTRKAETTMLDDWTNGWPLLRGAVENWQPAQPEDRDHG